MSTLRFRRYRLLVAGLLPLLLFAGCGVLPAAPASTPLTPETPLPEPSVSTPAVSASVPSTTRATGIPSDSPPAEPACATPEDAPETIPDADGPTLTATRVAKAWRASEAGKSHGVKTGKVKRSAGLQVYPSSVLDVRGTPWVALDIMEWSSVRTVVLTDPGVAAAKLATIRAMVREPCSYRFGTSFVVARLSDDRPDLVQVTGMMQGYPITDTFVRYGNTVTHTLMMLVPQDADEVRAMVVEALTGA